jgi:hypothetical protein
LERRVQHDAEAVDRGALSGELLQFAQVVGNHEVAHAAHIRKVLGAKAPRPTSFDFGDVTSDPAASRGRRSTSRTSASGPTTGWRRP